MLVDLFEDVGGAKGKGTQKMKEFLKTCKAIGLQPKKIKRFVPTRFRAYRLCLDPVIFNWEGLVKYYKEVKKPTDRQVRLRSFFVDQEPMSLLKVTFLLAATRDLMQAIDFFEKRTELLHKSRAKMEEVLRTQILKFHDESAGKVTDREGNSDIVLKKTGVQLLEVDLENEQTLKKEGVYWAGNQKTDDGIWANPRCLSDGVVLQKGVQVPREGDIKAHHLLQDGPAVNRHGVHGCSVAR